MMTKVVEAAVSMKGVVIKKTKVSKKCVYVHSCARFSEKEIDLIKIKLIIR